MKVLDLHIAVSQIGLPLIHIEAGDITMGGTYDDNVRHAISALSSLFITTNEKASKYLLDNNINQKNYKLWYFYW